MITLNCGVYANTGANASLSAATFIGTTKITFPEIFDVTEFKNYCKTSLQPITGSTGSPNSLYANILSVSEIDKVFCLLQYNSGGDMVGINQIKSLFANYDISTSTSFSTLLYDFGGDYYIVDCPSSVTCGLYSKDTEQLVQEATGNNILFGSFQYNVNYNNISFASCFYYNGKLVPVKFDLQRDSSYVHYIKMGRNRDERFYLPDIINQYIFDNIIPEDPYGQGGESGPGGGTGTFGGTGDDISIPPLPTLSAVNTGFITLFNPSASQLKSLANYMWSNVFDIETFKKIFANPMDCILGLSIVPVAVPDGGSGTVSVGNISTDISMTKAATQYVEVDCGTLNVEEFWGAYLDYDPYTKAEIYLPYIGTHPIAVDDIMGKSVHVVYHVDVLSGACTAYVKCGGSVLYQFIGQCSSSIPITGNDWTNVINGVISIAGAIGSMVATGGATAPMAAGTIASTAVNSMKPNIEKSGSMSGTGGMLAVQTPYLILTRPRQALPARQNEFTGYPSFITMSLGECSGYTEIEKVHLENISATEQELSEIENLLKGGVIF